MNFLIFDTETTGLTLHPDAKLELQPRIIEFAALLIDETGENLGEIDELLNPNRVITEEITKITGITNEDVQTAPSFIEIVDRIQELFSQADVMLAHNLPFDQTMLNLELGRIDYDFKFPKIGLCTVQEHAESYGFRPTLKRLYQDVVGKPLEQKHRALDDCEAMFETLIKGGWLDTLAYSLRAQP